MSSRAAHTQFCPLGLRSALHAPLVITIIEFSERKTCCLAIPRVRLIQCFQRCISAWLVKSRFRGRYLLNCLWMLTAAAGLRVVPAGAIRPGICGQSAAVAVFGSAVDTAQRRQIWGGRVPRAAARLRSGGSLDERRRNLLHPGFSCRPQPVSLMLTAGVV